MLKTQTKEHIDVLENKDTSGKTAKERILLQNRKKHFFFFNKKH